MKKYIILPILCFALLTCTNTETPKNFTMGSIDIPENISLVFYNVENLFDTKDDPHTNDNAFTPTGAKKWTKERYYKKIDGISQVINTINKKDWPIVIGLAEVENKEVLEVLSQEKDLLNANYEYVHYNSPDQRGIDVALMYRPDFFHVLKKKSISVYNPDFPNSKTRDILYVKGQFFNNEIFHFFVNHWSSRRDGTLETEPKRVFQAKILIKKIDAIQKENPQAKIVIMGDFNDYPTDKSLKQILKADVKKDGLYNLAYSLHMDDKGTINYKGDWGMFDQMIVSQSVLKAKGLHLQSKQQKVLKTDWLLWKGRKPNRTYSGNKYYGGYSDHLPIYINLKIEK